MSNRRWQRIQNAANTMMHELYTNDCHNATAILTHKGLERPVVNKQVYLYSTRIMVIHFLRDFDCILSMPFWILDGFWVHLMYHADGFWVVWSIFVMGEKKRHACMHQLTMISYLYSMLTANTFMITIAFTLWSMNSYNLPLQSKTIEKFLKISFRKSLWSVHVFLQVLIHAHYLIFT